MSNFINIQRKLSEGLYAWMLYEFHCNRAYIFNEKYISYPIANILANNLNRNQNILVEQNHPLQNLSIGRPIQIDFVVTDKYNQPNIWEIAIETKWIGNSMIKFSDVIWDLIRLQNLFKNYPNIKCYFLIAGNKNKIKKFWDNIDINNAVIENKIFQKNTTQSSFKLKNMKDIDKKHLNNKFLNYQNFNIYSKITCGVPFEYPTKDANNMTFGTFLIEVKAPDETLKITSIPYNILKSEA